MGGGGCWFLHSRTTARWKKIKFGTSAGDLNRLRYRKTIKKALIFTSHNKDNQKMNSSAFELMYFFCLLEFFCCSQ